MTTPRPYTNAWHEARYQAAKAIGATARPIDSATDRADALQRATAEWVRLGLATENEAWNARQDAETLAQARRLEDMP